MANTYVSRTPASTTNTTTWTWSGWVKLNKIGQAWFFGAYSSASLNTKIYLDGSNNLNVHLENGTAYRAQTDAVLRDFSAWYHIVVALDTTQATASNRIKVYINGTQQSLTAEGGGYPPQNYSGIVNNSSYEHNMGYDGESGDYFQGSMSHINFIDGTAYDATAFGEYDANGVWKIKTSPSVTYGTNGFFILKNGNSVTDQSGNSNNWTVAGGTLTNTEDNPSNVFSVGNSLIPSLTTYSNGNLTVSNGASWKSSGSTIAVTQGKWYAEMKVDTFVAVGMFFGVEDMDLVNIWSPSYVGTSVNGRGYYYNGNVYSNATISSYGSSYTTGDIIGCALDMDNKFVYFSKNGVFQNSGDPTSGATGTGGLTLGGTTYCIAYAVYNSTVTLNFGNGYFGTTAVASAGTNASGNGIFEYDVPTGYTALSTKGLNL